RGEPVSAAAHVAPRGHGILPIFLHRLARDFYPLNAGAGGGGGVISESHARDLEIPSLERRNEGNPILQRLPHRPPLNPHHNHGILKRETVHDILQSQDTRRVDLVPADGAAGHESAVSGVSMAHKVCDEIPEVRFAGADGGEAGVERGGGVADRGLEVGFKGGGEGVEKG
ncbi:MAG: hypothetical protein Q9211_002964, partial [Gyalolechia sp. 1 TL-2023]